jgi:hypothetical protein
VYVGVASQIGRNGPIRFVMGERDRFGGLNDTVDFSKDLFYLP